jgi:NADPH-dependent glutamate synthase beta subunit-like oxidoreductase/ferredoxin
MTRAAAIGPSDTAHPDWYHRVVDCQWACPAHTDVPEYIRLTAQGRYTDAYMLNRESNVFPGILGRTCDRPCEPACRRGRVEGTPVAVCRLKRVGADAHGDITDRLPRAPRRRNGKRVACIGAGPASLTVANDLLPLGYEVVVFDRHARAGGLMRASIPAFRLPARVLDEETDTIVDMGLDARFQTEVTSMRALLDDGYDAVFVGSGAPRGKEIDLPGRWESDRIHIGLDWLQSIAFGHITSVGERVLIIGVGNTAMDCCRSARRLGASQVTVMARRPRAFFKASPWELEDAEEEGVELCVNHAPRRFLVDDGRLVAVEFDRLEWDETARSSSVVGSVVVPCDDVILAIGQETAFPWIERDLGIDFGQWDLPVVDEQTMQATRPGVFFGGDAAWGPRNIVTAVAHGHEAAISIHNHCQGIPVDRRPPPLATLTTQKMGLGQWSYRNAYDTAARQRMEHAELTRRFAKLDLEVELGFSAAQAAQEVMRCLNCDIETVLSPALCIECDACVDVCPVRALTITRGGGEAAVRGRLSAPTLDPFRPLFVSGPLAQTGRLMVKDEDLCVHCGLCAERCPTAAWDMQKFDIRMPRAADVALEVMAS